MVRKEDLIRRTTDVMRENNICKPVSFPKHVFHISDDEGNVKSFPVKKTDKMMRFTAKDVRAVLDTFCYVIQEALKSGEEISVSGLGTFSLIYKKPFVVKNVLDGELVEIKGRYAPKFTVSTELRRCAHVYEQRLKDREANTIEPIPDEVLDEEE